MSTRALYTFIDSDYSEYTVFKHWDNYPSGAYGFIQKALSLAWELPRFEADEFAAAFIAANKKGGGDLRLLNADSTNGDALGIEYHYFISCYKNKIRVITRDLWNNKELDIVHITDAGIVATDSLMEA
jgi:hypothetical protein